MECVFFITHSFTKTDAKDCLFYEYSAAAMSQRHFLASVSKHVLQYIAKIGEVMQLFSFCEHIFPTRKMFPLSINILSNAEAHYVKPLSCPRFITCSTYPFIPTYYKL